MGRAGNNHSEWSVTQTQKDKGPMSFEDVIFESLDMFVSFRIPTDVSKLIRRWRRNRLQRREDKSSDTKGERGIMEQERSNGVGDEKSG